MPDTRPLSDQVRSHGGPLLSRIAAAKKRALALARKERAPKISLPPRWDDDYIFIQTTLDDTLSALQKAHTRSMTCCFCTVPFESIEALKKHSAGCTAHPLYRP